MEEAEHYVYSSALDYGGGERAITGKIYRIVGVIERHGNNFRAIVCQTSVLVRSLLGQKREYSD